MAGEAFEQLYDAVLTGDVTTFQQLLQQDPHLLHRVSYVYCPNTTPPLHLAMLQGNLGIVEEVLSINPLLARQLDCQKSSPLHIEIASLLLSADPKMCWRRDCHGMNPIHVAAMNGNLKILIHLITAEPFPVREKVDGGQAVLHLCVKHGQRKALELLVQILGDHLVSAEDHEGDTILHLAVRCYKTEMIEYLVKNTKIDKKSKNSKGQTPLKILKQIISYSGADETTTRIKQLLQSRSNPNQPSPPTPPIEWLTKKRDSIMVVAILIATMAFQAAVSPAGGVWQDDTASHRAGEAFMAYNNPKIYKNFIRSNTLAFVTSLSTILLLISGLPFKYRFFMWALMAIMWVSVTAVGVTYGSSIMVVIPKIDRKSLSHVIATGITVWASLMAVLIVGNTPAAAPVVEEPRSEVVAAGELLQEIY